MNNYELASLIRKNYTPLAFTCSCNGADESCANAMNDAATYRQYDTVERIARMVEGMESL